MEAGVKRKRVEKEKKPSGKKKQSGGRGKRCVAWGCGNTTQMPGVSTFLFPRDEALCKKWSSQIKKTRADWTKPSKWSVLCSQHFTEECFEEGPILRAAFGIETKRKLQLNKGAVPSIFSRPVRQSATQSQAGPSKARPCYVKRERKRTSEQILAKYQGASHSGSAGEPTNTDTDMDTDMTQTDTQKEKLTRDQGCQTENLMTATVKTQTSKTVRNIKTKTTGCQVTPDMIHMSRGSSNNLEAALNNTAQPVMGHRQKLPHSMEDLSSSSSSDDPDSFTSSDWEPSLSNCSSSDMSEEEEEEEETGRQRHPSCHKETKYIVFGSSLQILLQWCHCPSCGSVNIHLSWTTYGTLLIITLVCKSCGKSIKWSSQSSIGPYAGGDILLSAGILFAGASVAKVLRVLQFMGVATYSARTFYNHQTDILHPVIQRVWEDQQTAHLSLLQVEDRPLTLGGDGRADSPGHSAKYGTYTTMELEANVVIDLQLVQSNEVGSSYHMEIEGLKRMLKCLQDDWHLMIGTLITDRHAQITKWVAENKAEITHLYDIWHVAKSVTKKLKAASRVKGCEDLIRWQQSINNHLYWAVISTPAGECDLAVEKWKSVERHVQNLHRNHGTKFRRCAHAQIRGKDRQKKWLKPGTLAAVRLEEIVTNRSLCKDIAKLSGGHQTFRIEAFHSLVNHFAPKMHAFTFTGMLCRTFLAGLHYNENAARPAATTKEGQQRYAVRFPKYKSGGHVVKKILQAATYNYVDDLMQEMVNLCNKPRAERPTPLEEPATLAAGMDRPDKAEAVKASTSRFKAK